MNEIMKKITELLSFLHKSGSKTLFPSHLLSFYLNFVMGLHFQSVVVIYITVYFNNNKTT